MPCFLYALGSCNETPLHEEAIPFSLLHELSRLFAFYSDQKPPPLSRDVEKRQKEAEASVGGAVGDSHNVLKGIIVKASIVTNTFFIFLGEFVQASSTNPENIPTTPSKRGCHTG